jgi:small subunit ribosomal protein S3
MTRRSTKLMRLENSLYNYNSTKESWDVKEISHINDSANEDLFELGSYFTCKHMSQKVNPISLRINKSKTWESAWYTSYKYFGMETGKLQIDLYIRNYVQSVLKELKILTDKIYIKEIDNKYFIKLCVYEQGVVSKRDVQINPKRNSRFPKHILEKETSLINPFYKNKGKDNKKNWFIQPKKVINHIEAQLKSRFDLPFFISLEFKKDVGESASLLGNYLVRELEKPNMSFKRVLKDALYRIKSKDNIRGLRVNCSGRLGRAPMAKMEWFRYGSIPLTKLSADIDYVQLTGRTKYGSFGIKVWLYKH